QLLGDAHGALRAVAELAGGLLLQGGGGEGRGRVAAALLLLDAGDLELAIGRLEDGRLGALGGLLVAEAELLDLGALELPQPRLEGLAVLLGLAEQGPVFLALELLDLVLALADQAQRRRLHAAGGEAAADL